MKGDLLSIDATQEIRLLFTVLSLRTIVLYVGTGQERRERGSKYVMLLPADTCGLQMTAVGYLNSWCGLLDGLGPSK